MPLMPAIRPLNSISITAEMPISMPPIVEASGVNSVAIATLTLSGARDPSNPIEWDREWSWAGSLCGLKADLTSERRELVEDPESRGAGLLLARGVLDEGRPKFAQLERKHGGELDRRAAIDALR
jgi:hypothetical protein